MNKAFLGISVLVFIACAVMTVFQGIAMQRMNVMSMPGGWTISMTWMIMPGQTWLSSAISFINMWIIMMVPMMMPSLLLMLSKYCHEAGKPNDMWLHWSVALIILGYFFVWVLCGVGVFCAGIGAAKLEMRSSTLSLVVPIIDAGAIIAAGAYQFTTWKTQQLACCNQTEGPVDAAPGKVFKHGLRLGLYCCGCCMNLTIILLVAGMMNLKVMAVITVAITAERFYSNNKKIVYGIGAGTLIVGFLFFIKAIGIK